MLEKDPGADRIQLEKKNVYSFSLGFKKLTKGRLVKSQTKESKKHNTQKIKAKFQHKKTSKTENHNAETPGNRACLSPNTVV